MGNQDIELFVDTLGTVKLLKEKKLLQKFMDEISQDTGKYCFGVEDTLVMRNTTDGTTSVTHLLNTKESKNNDDHLKCPETGAELDVIETEPLVDWMANNYKNFGCKLEFVTDRSGEGTQFTKGFGGIGGILRWKVDFVELSNFDHNGEDDNNNSDSDDDDDDYGFDDGDFGF